MFGNFTDEAQKILIQAKIEMCSLKHPYVGSEHLILSLLNNDKDIADKLKKYNLNYEEFKKEIIKVIGVGSKKSELYLYTPLLKKIIQNAILDSKDNNNGVVTTNHLFLALLEEGEGIAIRIMLGMGIDLEALYDDFSFKLVNKRKNNDKKLLLYKLGIDLTEMAGKKEIDPVVGREKEIKRLLEILGRRTKNNPLLIGKAGVGKTDIVEELARLIVEEKVPDNLRSKKIISLDMASVVAGTKYRGEFEEKMQRILEELENNKDLILFIDEVHTLVGAGGAEGAIDASNIFKPVLARGQIRCIGATTEMEYKKFIEVDKALDRRFQKIYVDEPDRKTTKNILMSLKSIYESYHKVEISEEIIDKIISLSDKYIYNANRPDKAIDVLDEVCSMVSMKKDDNEEKLGVLRKELEDIQNEKNSYIIDNDIDKALELRKKEGKLISKLNTMELEYRKVLKKVTVYDVAYVINVKTKIPVYEIMQDNEKIIKKIESGLKREIIGQDKAIEKIIDITKRIKLGYKDSKVYSMLFIGPTGVGKTKLAKLFSELVFGRDSLIRLDMSEYGDSMGVNKILGSAPGYVGYSDNKNVLEMVKNNPNSVILMDEIDKAHSSVINIMYQILDEGRIKDSKGEVVRFDNTVIIMTSNVGYETNMFGFNEGSSVNRDLKNMFSMAFINRIDDIIKFNRLDSNSIIKIIKKDLKKLENKYKDINLDISNNIIKEIEELADYENFGARKVEKIIETKLENVIIDLIIRGNKEIKVNSLKVSN